ncbi:hypothetical protein [Burkholderia pseudomallei]|uniref:hypothetical protein n=1 Tax=Burkholderia pseudomallei TaxID=28450 RepID=UPI0009CF87A0|nr:hypothetical protein [Burkholderia pseudomallei]OMR20468.1 hypothetical protein AQ721_18790 [Burkholderia pseudomallei]
MPMPRDARKQHRRRIAEPVPLSPPQCLELRAAVRVASARRMARQVTSLSLGVSSRDAVRTHATP